MRTLQHFLLAMAFVLLAIPVFSQGNAAEGHACCYEKSAGTCVPKTKVQVFDQEGNLEYETTVTAVSPALEELLPEGSVYLFTHERVAYYMLENKKEETYTARSL